MTKPAPQTDRKPFTDSMFYMWRSIISVAHADGVLHAKERELFDKVFVHLEQAYDIPPARRGTFEKDLAGNEDINTFLPHITDPECKALLLFFAQVVASIDGVLAYDEATLVGKLHATLADSPDTRDRVTEIRKAIADQMTQRRADKATKPDRNPIYYALDALLLRLGVTPID